MRNAYKLSLAMLVGATMLQTSIASAQGPGGGPPPGDQQGGFPGGPPAGGFGGGPPAGFPPGPPPLQERVFAVTTPIATLTTALSLTTSEQSQIEAIQTEYRGKMQDLMPAPADDGGFGRGLTGPPKIDAATRDKVDELTSKMSPQIDAVLSPAQLTLLATLITQLKEMQIAHISPRLYPIIGLTSDQFDQIAKIEAAAKDLVKIAVEKAAATQDFDELEISIQDSHQETQSKVAAILTSSQSAIVQRSMQGRGGGLGFRFGGPQGGFGGPGQNGPQRGFGGPPQGQEFGGPDPEGPSSPNQDPQDNVGGPAG